MKRLLSAIFISSLMLTGCTPKEKTTILEEDVLINEIDYANKINMEKLDIKLEDGYQFEPGYIYEDTIYGIIRNQGEPDNKIYKGYYSKSTGLVKEEEILEVEAFSDISYKNRRVISDFLDYKNPSADDDSIKIRDNLTGEVKKFPDYLPIVNEIRVSSDKDYTSNPYFQALNIQTTSTEKIAYGDAKKIVAGNFNYGYNVYSRSIFEGEESTPVSINSRYIKRDYKKSYNALLLYNFNDNTTVTYDGNLSAEEFPYIEKIMYDDKNNAFYALAGQLESQIYKIDIKADKFTLQLIYTFDLGERYINSWNAKIIDGNLIMDSDIPVTNSIGEIFFTSDKVLLFNLSSLELTEASPSTDVNSRLLSLDSDKYFIISNYDTNSKEGKILLARINNNKIEYVYNFNSSPTFTSIDDQSKKLFISSFTGNDDNMEYYLYNIDID